MKLTFSLACFVIIFSWNVAALLAGDKEYGFAVSSDGFLPPARHDAYGPGIEADASGRPFFWSPKTEGLNAPPASPDATLRVKPDAYGPGLGADQYGRPVERKRF
ncbi:MAG: hypothetical protein NTX71_05090 [Candidatus Aureabacteria bacterium]|nr:hypothetical protein [Candidatus Auribacterota bacterium]